MTLSRENGVMNCLMETLMKTIVRHLSLILLFIALAIPGSTATTTTVKGIWTGSPVLGLIAAEIEGKIEMICLPRLEFIGAVDHNQLVGKITTDIKRQNAVFQL